MDANLNKNNMKRTLQLYEGIEGKCGRAAHNPNSPFVDSDKVYEGYCHFFPQVGYRFRCGSLDTNVVAKIVEQKDDYWKFETLSGSIYEFTMTKAGKEDRVIDFTDIAPLSVLEEVKKQIEEYNAPKKEEGFIVTIVKLSDDKFDGMHPNGIDEGYVKSGKAFKMPTVGERFFIGYNWATSEVTEIVDEVTFKTLNSTYKITSINRDHS